MRDPLICDVHDCENPALARVYPTNGRTNHAALRCRDCLGDDLDREWFKQWRQAIAERDGLQESEARDT